MLMRFDPFRSLDQLTQQVTAPARSGLMAMDAYREGDHVVVHFDVPGVSPDAVDLTVEKNVLTVSVERSWERREDQQILVNERVQGRSSRQLFLGESLDLDRVEANVDDGVLTIRIPVAEQAKPRKVAVGHSGAAQAIEADVTS